MAFGRSLAAQLGPLHAAAAVYAVSAVLSLAVFVARPARARAALRLPPRYLLVGGPLFVVYALCLYLFATAQVDCGHVAAGWVFVAFRTLHSAVHCTFNLVMLRFYLYLVATLAVWLMLGRAALAHFGG